MVQPNNNTNRDQQLHLSSDKALVPIPKNSDFRAVKLTYVWLSEPQIGILQYHAIVFASLMFLVSCLAWSCLFEAFEYSCPYCPKQGTKTLREGSERDRESDDGSTKRKPL